MNALPPRDPAVEVARREQQQAAGLEQTRDELQRLVRGGQMLDHFNHADHVVTRVGFARQRLEIENTETVPLLQKIRVRTDIVSRELEWAAAKRAALAQVFQECAGATAEIEPCNRGLRAVF